MRKSDFETRGCVAVVCDCVIRASDCKNNTDTASRALSAAMSLFLGFSVTSHLHPWIQEEEGLLSGVMRKALGDFPNARPWLA